MLLMGLFPGCKPQHASREVPQEAMQVHWPPVTKDGSLVIMVFVTGSRVFHDAGLYRVKEMVL